MITLGGAARTALRRRRDACSERWRSVSFSLKLGVLAPATPTVQLTGHSLRSPYRRLPGVATAAVLVLLLDACAAKPSLWQSEHGRRNPLVGHIWDVHAAAYVDENVLADRLSSARFVLLGEQHDNPDHHSLQGQVIRALVHRGRKPSVVMEMLDIGESDAIASCVQSPDCSPRRFAEAVQWQKSGWPDWRIYKPVLSAALDAHLPLAPGNLPTETVRDYTRTGEIEGGEPVLRRLGLDVPLAPDVRAAMAEEIRQSHCGHAPEGMIDPMIAAQRLRDAHMAESLLLAAPMGRAVLIAGFGHTRNDRGVPTYLRREMGEDTVMSVAFIEVDDARTDPSAYASSFGTNVLPFDFVWFTPRFDDSDPCEQFRLQLEKLRESSKGA